MRDLDTLPQSPSDRLDLALDYAWKIVKSKFRGGRILVTKEAPLQHHYAQALSSLGGLFSTDRNEFWMVDLERKEQDLTRDGHSDYIDVVCEVRTQRGEPIKSAVEMKFKEGSKGAPRASLVFRELSNEEWSGWRTG